MGNNEEERLRREKIELLKLKQGIIDESDIIPQNTEEARESTFGQKAEAFLDLNKGFIAIGVLVLAAIIGVIVLFFSREAEDLMVLVVITEKDSVLKEKSAEIEQALEMYCPDFDGNGKIHVNVAVADISQEEMGDFQRAQSDRLSLELDTRYRQLIISDSGFLDYIKEAYGENASVIMEEEPSGISLNTVHFSEHAGVGGCPDDIKFFIRSEMKSDPSTATVQRERALEVIKNVIDDRAVSAEG